MLKGINDVICDGDYMWIMSEELPCLFRYNNVTHEIELKAIFPDEVDVMGAFSRMIKLGSEIYFIPWIMKEIYYYDIVKDEFHKLDLIFKDFSSDNNRQTEVVAEGVNLYCINRIPDAVIEINSVTKEVKVFQTDMQLYKEQLLPWGNWKMALAPCIYQGKIIWTNYKNILFIFDMTTKEFSMEKIAGLLNEKPQRSLNVAEDYMIGVRAFGGALWLLTFEGRVYRYDNYNNAIQKIEDPLFDDYIYYEDSDNIVVNFFYDIVPLENDLFFIPSYKNKCIKYDGSKDQYEETLDDYAKNWKYNRRNYTVCKVIHDKKILLYSYNENIFYILDTKKNIVWEWKIEVPWIKFARENPLFERAVARTLIRNNLYLLDELDELDWLIQFESLDDAGREEKLLVSTVGERIYVMINNA